MTNRHIAFIGYETLPQRAEPETPVSEFHVKMIAEKIEQAPAGKYAMFSCDDNYHAVKSAYYLRQALGNQYTFTARRNFVYGCKR